MALGDLTTVAAVKAQMGTTGTAADAVIDVLITAASNAIRAFTGREFAPVATNPATRLIDADLYTAEVPIGALASMPTLVEVLDERGALVRTLSTASDLEALPLFRESDEPITSLRIRRAVTALSRYQQLRITGTWGYPSVPKDVEQACIVTVRAWLRSDAASSAEYGYDSGGRVVQATPEGGWMLPMAAKQLLEPYADKSFA